MINFNLRRVQKKPYYFFKLFRSGSMDYSDRRPLGNTPTTGIISRRHNNRLGAVYSSLQAFWAARSAANAGQAAAIRRDAYTVLLFNQAVSECVVHDFASTPDQLLNAVLRFSADGGTNFTSAIQVAQAQMERHWSPERYYY